MQNKIVILQDSEQAISNLISVIEEISGFEIVGSSVDGEEGVKLIEKFQPDFVIVGVVLKSIDGFGVMEKVAIVSAKTQVIVVSSFTSESIITRALNSGAVYYIAKPFKPEIIKNRLIELSNKVDVVKNVNGIEKRKNTLDEKISKIFISVGIPPHIKGYYYLREGVKMAIETPEIINNITKQLYPKIGEKYKTTASKVERAIRHAIEVAFNRGRIETINSILGIRAYVGKEKPTNGEFIALIADKMLLEGA
ncbi:MAG: sporulation transcription factor Spo0A [Clostridiales bacterium]|nr:sporulation transcription factor Spo0A [Clostridiales bacterium]